jgi:hypothetical protein
MPTLRTRRLLLAATALTTSLLGVSCKKERPKYANDKRPMYSPDAGVDAAPADAGEATPPAGEP